ncbi:hypothetical protein C8R45DRAFT_833165, partial [Mycena sanguinolenta]
LGALHVVTRRLNTSERQVLQTGCVYVWEERSPMVKIAKTTDMSELPIECWTDSRRCGPSRREEVSVFVRCPNFSQVFYGYQCNPLNHISFPSGCGMSEKEPLCKQTYSAFVKTEGAQKTLHLIAYFTRSTVEQLGTVDSLPDVRHLQVPAGMFVNARKHLGPSLHKHWLHGQVQ